ncbi:MAG TPA: Smr/MutS family protein [Terriglobales bacterium]
MKLVNLELGMPTVHEALVRLAAELATARREGCKMLKIIHGYGSSGAGGEIRIAIQKRLCELAQSGEIRACIYGEHWSKSDETTWKLLASKPDLKRDPDLGRGNRGITIILL